MSRSTSLVALQPFRDQDQAGEALAPNFWGPAFTPFAPDTYDGRTRLVQYFDKGRMELTGTTVTGGLLATELITGQIQVGDATFQPKSPPAIPIAGDPDGGGATYATLGTTAAMLLATTPASRLGLPITTTVAADGTITAGTPGPFTTGPTVIGNYDFPTQHNVASAFVDYRTKVGLQNIGYAKSEPFLTTVKVAGQSKQVLVQVFERRVLTYTAEQSPTRTRWRWATSASTISAGATAAARNTCRRDRFSPRLMANSRDIKSGRRGMSPYLVSHHETSG